MCRLVFYIFNVLIYLYFYFVAFNGLVVASKSSQKRSETKTKDYDQDSTADDDSLFPLNSENLRVPIVVNTWNYTGPNIRAWESLNSGQSPVDSIVNGLSVCEFNPNECDRQVGFGDNPNENGETTLDSMIMDGNTMNTGGVGGLRRIKNSVRVAKYVLENTKHSLLVGDLATEFAVNMGFQEESLSSNISFAEARTWRFQNHCQPNHWVDVNPDPTKSCGPYRPISTIKRNQQQDGEMFENNIDYLKKIEVKYYKPQKTSHSESSQKLSGRNLYDPWPRNSMHIRNERSHRPDYHYNHDTITMIVLNENGEIAAGSSTNGLIYKIPGRVGDSPLPGAGVYADARVGAAVATGDGDIMQRFVPSFLAVEEMRRGSGPSQAVFTAVSRIAEFYPNFWGAVVAVNKNGTYAAACSGMEKFPFSVTNNMIGETRVFWISCLHIDDDE